MAEDKFRRREKRRCSNPECGRPIVVRGRSGKNRNRMKDHDLCEHCWQKLGQLWGRK